MDNHFWTRGSVLWRQGTHDHKEYTNIALERLERHYDDEGKPLPQWTATLIAYTFEDIDSLRNFPEFAEVTVTYKRQGRRDVFETDEVLLRMTNCKPVRGWFEWLVVYRGDGTDIVPYKLFITCEVEYLFDVQRLTEKEAKIASIKPISKPTPAPKSFWGALTGKDDR